MRVHDIRQESENVVSVELGTSERGEGRELPPFSAGSHVDLHLPVGIRSYSLTNSPAETHRYVVAVGLSETSRGGSEYVHRALRAGASIEISSPRNLFPLVDSEAPVVLIAGGIWITPIRCMFNELRAAEKEVSLIYCARSRQSAAFAGELSLLLGVKLHFDDETGHPPDLELLLAKAAPEMHFYGCGPPADAGGVRAGREKPVDTTRASASGTVFAHS